MATSELHLEGEGLLKLLMRQWRELKKKVPLFGRRKRHFVGYLATTMFKMSYANVKKRFHVFINEDAKLYPPPSP